MQGFFNLDRGDSQLKEGKATSTIVVVVEDLMVLDSTPVADLGNMSSQDYPTTQAGMNQDDEAAAFGGSSGRDGLQMVAPPSQGVVSNELMASTDSSLLTKQKGAVGGPSGLILDSPKASSGFAATTTSPPTLCRNSKTKLRSSTMFKDKPIVIDMEAALRAVADKLVVGQVLSPYLADPRAVVNEVKGAWRLRGEAVA
ncbi:uncharacterized protein [Triticum aestivum]|uniref:uncharacterized protein n=1 Tax=Triticum aestivum TaxID=4565 RepID=UPI001D00F3F4|nr:uncharacterized protein LOC123133986 [Triticum aestivum]